MSMPIVRNILKTLGFCLFLSLVMILHKTQQLEDTNPKSPEITNNSIKQEQRSVTKDNTYNIKINDEEEKNGVVSILEIKEIINNPSNRVIIIDSRSRKSYERGHIPTSINIPLSEYPEDKENFKELLSQFDEIIIYCSSANCNDSKKLKFLMLEDMKKNIRVFEGGYKEWILEEIQDTLNQKY
jgi:rhodanese-related sulfurtransferase